MASSTTHSIPSTSTTLDAASKSISQPLIHFHPQYFQELRNKLTKDSKTYFLLKTLLKKVMLDDSLHSVTYSKRYGPGGRLYLLFPSTLWFDSE